MAFQYIDSAAYGDDKPLDTFLIKQNRRNLEAFADIQPTQGVWAPHAFNTNDGSLILPEISCHPYYGRALIPFVFPLPPRVTSLNLMVEQQVSSAVTASPYTQEVVMSAYAQSLDEWAQGRNPPAGDSANLTGNAGSSSMTELSLDVSSLSPGWILVMLGWQSGTANAGAQMITNSTPLGPPVFTGWYSAYFTAADAASYTLGSGNAINHWAIQVLDTGAKASANVPGLARPRQLLFLEDTSSGAERYRLYVYPRMDQRYSVSGDAWQDTANDALYYTELGYTTLSSVTIYTKDVDGLPDTGNRTDAPRPASTRNLAPEIAAEVKEWLTRPRIHALGPAPLLTQRDWTSQGPVNRISSSVELTTSYQTLASAPIGDDDAFEREGQTGSSTYIKTAIEVCAIVLLTLPTDHPGGGFSYDLDLRLRCSDRDGSSNTADASRSVTLPAARSPANLYRNIRTHPYNPASALAGFAGVQADPHTLMRQVFSGAYPQGAWRNGDWQIIKMDIVDTNTAEERLISLQVKSQSATTPEATAGGGRGEYAPRVHLVTWTVASKAWYDNEPTPGEVGV